MGVPYETQVAGKVARARELLGAVGEWLPPVTSRPWAFRAKAKMVVGGTIDAPTIGILDEHRRGQDLRECGVIAPGIHDTFPALAAFVTRAAIEPYDVESRRGELKHLVLVESPDGALMLRFVLRSREAESRIRKHLPSLLMELPGITVASLNLQPDHKAIIEGPDEIVLTVADTLTMTVNDVTLRVRPNSFVQTNTPVAAALYAQARAWVDELAPATVWDLYCGVGGFALHVARTDRRVTGVEVSADAISSARAAGVAGAEFIVADATAFAEQQPSAADVVIVNPPRRGLGDRLSAWLEARGPASVIYSSCNAVTLARDLLAMPSYEVVRARVFDMFPQTSHFEVMTLLRRTT
jgi:23S rRNA (uracil747-C5)-methyltransferase